MQTYGAIVIEEMSQNANHRNYHLRVSIKEKTEWYVLERDAMHFSESEERRPPEIFKHILSEVPGAISVSSFHAYEIGITRSPAFSWDEIEEKLLPILREFSRDETPVEAKPRPGTPIAEITGEQFDAATLQRGEGQEE